MRAPVGGKDRLAQRRRARSGVTLLEMLLVLVMIVILSAAVTSAFVAGINTESQYAKRRQQDVNQGAVETKITQLIQGAILSESTTDTSAYFLGEYGNVGTESYSTSAGASGTSTGTSAAATGSSGGSGSNTSSNGTDLGCDRLVFTTTTPDVPLASQVSTDDFETQHQNYGPIGGAAEVSFSTTAVGDAGDRTGLFERIQRPSDADATQGGTESLLGSQIQNMGFQFWDGAEWVDTWDTTTTPDTGRLPAAVMVRYTLKGDLSETIHELLVAVPGSNVTTANPVTQTTSAN